MTIHSLVYAVIAGALVTIGISGHYSWAFGTAVTTALFALTTND